MTLQTIYLVLTLFPESFGKPRPRHRICFLLNAGKSCPNCFQVSFPDPSSPSRMLALVWGRKESLWIRICFSNVQHMKIGHLMWSKSHFFLCIWWMLISCFRFSPNDLLLKIMPLICSFKTIPYKTYIWDGTCGLLKTITFPHCKVFFLLLIFH